MLSIFNTDYGNITLYTNDIFITNSFKKGKYWDIDNLLRLKEYINPDKNILEIGGHCGTSSIVYASFLNPSSSKIFVYEPQINMYNLLRVNIIQNNLEHIIKPYNKGVFCKEMTGHMNNIDLDGGGGNVQKRYNEEHDKPCNFGGIGLGLNGETTQLITIDNMKHNNIGFIHCDAQGAENFIFSKGTETIKKYKPIILYENNARYSKYLYNNVCKSYPNFKHESEFDIAKFCVKELHYRKIIRKFGKSEDDLLIP